MTISYPVRGVTSIWIEASETHHLSLIPDGIETPRW